MDAIDKIPPQIRAILAGLVVAAMAKIGIAVTESDAVAVVAVVVWVAGGLGDWLRQRANRGQS